MIAEKTVHDYESKGKECPALKETALDRGFCFQN